DVRAGEIRAVVVSGIFIRRRRKSRHSIIDFKRRIESVMAWCIWIRRISSYRTASEVVIDERPVDDSGSAAQHGLLVEKIGRPRETYARAEILVPGICPAGIAMALVSEHQGAGNVVFRVNGRRAEVRSVVVRLSARHIDVITKTKV